jgi:replicative DNA helicase
MTNNNATNLLEHIYIFDSSICSVESIRLKCKEMSAKGGTDLIIVDYIQLLQEWREYKETKDFNFMDRLKTVAKSLNACVLLINAIRKGIKEVRLNDLPNQTREFICSAETFMILDRPEAYFDDKDYWKICECSRDCKLDIYHKNGIMIGTTSLFFNNKTPTFVS